MFLVNRQQLIDSVVPFHQKILLRDFYNDKVSILQEILDLESNNIKDTATKIKITEVAKLLTKLGKNDKVDSDNLVDLLQYYELVKEIQVANGKVQV